jgi:hypothetical protein
MKFVRDCQWQWQHEWSRVDDDGKETVVAKSTALAPARPIGVELNFKVTHQLPPAVNNNPGDYVISSFGQGVCANGEVVTQNDDEFHFSVY